MRGWLVMPAASAGTRGELWAPHRRPSALEGSGDIQILWLSRYLGCPQGSKPIPQKSRAGLPGCKDPKDGNACAEGKVLKFIDLTSRRG